MRMYIAILLYCGSQASRECCLFLFLALFHLYIGAGVHFENAFLGTVANNTAVVNQGSSDTLLCQSALRNSCNTGNWKNPNDNYISNVTSLSQVCSNSEPISQFFSTAQLSLSPDLSSGLYTCVIPDETLLIRKVYIGVYSDIEERGGYTCSDIEERGGFELDTLRMQDVQIFKRLCLYWYSPGSLKFNS